MTKRIIFRGVGTALVTPFRDGKIDYSALEGLIEAQIAAGIDALIVGGTTGEAATLEDGERYELYGFAKEKAALYFVTKEDKDGKKPGMHLISRKPRVS